MRVLVMALAGAAMMVSACGRSDNDAATNQDVVVSNDLGMNTAATAGAAPAALPTDAQGFVNAAAASDRFEIESSRLAEASGQSAGVKAFARQMISGHTASTAKLKSTVAGMTPALTPTDTLNADQQALMASLQGKTGAELDTAYAAAQVTAHQKTLDMLNAYAAGGDNPQLMAFAKGMVPTVAAHLNLAKGLK
jgi:putative membrane protein